MTTLEPGCVSFLDDPLPWHTLVHVALFACLVDRVWYIGSDSVDFVRNFQDS